jgi:hypothetical protein
MIETYSRSDCALQLEVRNGSSHTLTDIDTNDDETQPTVSSVMGGVTTVMNHKSLNEIEGGVVLVWCSRGVVWCGVVWCGVVWCGVVWCGVV